MTEDTQPTAPPVSWRSRIVAALAYAGLATFVALWLRTREDAYVQHHLKQALSVWTLAFGILFFYIATSLTISYILVFHRTWYEDTPLEPTLLMLIRRAFLCWLVVLAFSIFWALRVSWAPIPLYIGRLAERPRVMRFSLVMCTALLIFSTCVAATTAHALTLTREEGPPAQAYMLYDDMGVVPHWIFHLGFYPIALEATEQWGADSVIVAPMTKERMAEAFANGHFVFLLSHGTEEGLFTRDFRVSPAESAPKGIGDDLQLVYITGCDSGAREQEWKDTLSPARVITFNRLSAWLEHIYWLLLRGAGEVGELS